MPVLPGLLGLTSIADGALAVAADVRNNFAAIQTEANALLGILDDGVAGDVLTGVGTTLAFAKPPGYEYTYAEVTANVTTVVTSAATAVAAVTAGAVTFDGSTKVCIEFFCPEVFHSVANTAVVFELYDGATDLGILARGFSALTNQGPSVRLSRVLTPSAAAHTYSVRIWGAAAGTSNANAGAGGASTDLPMFLRVLKA